MLKNEIIPIYCAYSYKIYLIYLFDIRLYEYTCVMHQAKGHAFRNMKGPIFRNWRDLMLWAEESLISLYILYSIESIVSKKNYYQ